MRTWLRRWLGLERDAVTQLLPPSELERRVDALEEHLDFVHGSLRKLRGRVTGGLREEVGVDRVEQVASEPSAPAGNPRAIELLRKRGRI